MSARRFQGQFDEAADLEEARTRADSLDLSTRLEETIAMHIVTVVEIARSCADAEELYARLDREPPGCPYDRWVELGRAGRREVHG